jgi:hypothetical protein
VPACLLPLRNDDRVCCQDSDSGRLLRRLKQRIPHHALILSLTNKVTGSEDLTGFTRQLRSMGKRHRKSLRVLLVMLDGCAFWVGADDNGVSDRNDLVDRQIRPGRVLTYRLWAAGLVDAYTSD